MTAPVVESSRRVAARRGVGRATDVLRRWWRGEAGWWGRPLDLALLPAEAAYRLIVRARNRGYDSGRLAVAEAGVPVVSVGNLSVGGTGKTPVVRWLVDELLALGAKPAILHGGYARDEPALHRRWHPDVPVIAVRDRVAGARLARGSGASVLILDDGFQHRRLRRDLDLVLVAAETWTPRPRLLPRGPWREPPSGLRRAHAVAVTRRTAPPEAAARVAAELLPHAPGAVILRLWLRPAGWTRVRGAGAAECGSRPAEVVAVSGIAEPEAFVQNLEEAGARVAAVLAFPDHHEYTERDMSAVRRRAAGRSVATTAKDAVKLAGLASSLELWVLEQEVTVESGTAELLRLLESLNRSER